MNRKVSFFDLDDTLYNEIDYLNSAYKEIALFIAEKSQGSIIAENIYNDLFFYSRKKRRISRNNFKI
jgi:putative hydrolase of the HAD superfamily